MMSRWRARALPLLLCLYAAGLFVLRRPQAAHHTQGRGSLRRSSLLADKETLIARVAREYQAVQDFSATVDMTPALGSSEKSKITEYKDVRGYILFRKPADIRIIGLYPVVRNKAFDMVSDRRRFSPLPSLQQPLHRRPQRSARPLR